MNPKAGPSAELEFEKLERLTRSFAAVQGDAPRLTLAYIGEVNDALKPTLLRNLLQVDIQRRRLRGDQPAASDYLPWFPDHGSLIRQEFTDSAFGCGGC